MNVERTVEFLLKQAAKVDANMQASVLRHARAEKRMATVDKRLDALVRVAGYHQTQIDVLLTAVRELTAFQRRHHEELLILADSQRRSDKRLD